MFSGGYQTINGKKEMSKIVMGTFTMGSVQTMEESFRILDRYIELGGRSIDTARSYNGEVINGDSKSEYTVGKWLKKSGMRKVVSLSTKGAYPELRNMHYSRLSPDCIRYDINTSLAVLDEEYVDLYILHRDDEKVPVGEIMDALHECVKAGMTTALGASNWTTERIEEANAYAKKNGKTPFTVSQIQWNMAYVTRDMMPDDTMLPMLPRDYEWYKKNGFPVMAYSSQAVGFFSIYPKRGEAGLIPRGKMYATPTNIKRSKLVDEICAQLGLTPAQLCIAYLTNNAVDGYAIVGCANVAELEDTLSAADLRVDQSILDRIETCV
jgi:aryl-alcohol dehydrogenase-like predicted oxidoreductase